MFTFSVKLYYNIEKFPIPFIPMFVFIIYNNSLKIIYYIYKT